MIRLTWQKLSRFQIILGKFVVSYRFGIKRNLKLSRDMAKSKFEYVKEFEQDIKCLNNCWIVVRVDGKAFHKFTENHNFKKPNDCGGLNLMTRAAASVMDEFRDIVIAFGHSDEYSFIFRKSATLFNRRSEKIVSLVNSLFSSSYVFYWKDYFPNTPMIYPPAFDARIILYPTDENLRHYMSWRQADVHVNNLYNTCFWLLVLKNKLSPFEAQEKLKGTLASDKNELLFQEFNINYNNEPEIFKKGTTLIRKRLLFPGQNKPQLVTVSLNCDIIQDLFWKENEEILQMKKVPSIEYNDNLTFFKLNERLQFGKKISEIDS